MSWAAKSYTFSPSTIADAGEVNQNFDDMVAQLNTAMPSGAIIMWSGSVVSIPAGYYLCDGNNSTPDLRGRFVIGAGGSYAVAATGGEATHVLTIDEIPSHTHSMGITHGDQDGSGSNGAIDGTLNTGAAGGGQAHNNLPPYYALCFIMKS